MKTDLIIIGAGPGGYETAHYAATHGLSVVIFEKDELGGTCLNRGCIPTKTLCKNAEVISNFRNSAEFGISDVSYTVDFAKMVERKNNVVSQLREGVAMALNHSSITLVRGEAVIMSCNTVACDGELYECDNLIVATGSSPKMLLVEGNELSCVLTSDDILDMSELPQSLCIIGGGVIGLEFASIFNSLGVKVSIVEFCKEIIPNFDGDLAKRLRQALVKKGVEISVGAGVTGIVENGDGSATVKYEQKGKSLETVCEKVLMAVGRAPRMPKGLETAGIDFSQGGIPVDDNMCSNVPGIYAIGDVNARCMLAHAAVFQGKRAVNHILGIEDNIRLDIMPSAIFTVPEAAMVGITDAECKAQGIDAVVKKAFFRANGKAVAMGETDGILKLVVSSENKKILGCHILGAHAADLIQEVASLMNCDETADKLKDIVHAHPTLGEVVYSAAMQN
ncbi:MAG: dihydrolipoyl dehydrogenase [Muribaculaceae bacterium]|nr:dihydrolipoyl dehydrogenase [Muribaculaceae bacterium]